MITSFLLGIYLILYHAYLWLWLMFFSKIRNLTLVYFVRDNKITNITLQYYLNFWLDNYKLGTYYLRIYNLHGTNHLTYTGALTDIPTINPIYNTDVSTPRRKDVLLMLNSQPVCVDLAVIDNYRVNTIHLNGHVEHGTHTQIIRNFVYAH